MESEKHSRFEKKQGILNNSYVDKLLSFNTYQNRSPHY